MEDSNDFSFCQVAFAGDSDQLESPKFVPDRSKDHGDIFRDFPAPMSLKFGSDDISQSQTSNLIMAGSFQSKSESSEEFVSSTMNAVDTQIIKAKESDAKVINELGTSISINLQVDERRKKPIQRAKVPFEKGFSQMDWLKLTRTHPDLADLKGQSNRRLITMDEVKQHNSEGSMWTVLRGRVYNISPYMNYHPGGADMLMKAGGKDCTSLFNKYHAWVNADFYWRNAWWVSWMLADIAGSEKVVFVYIQLAVMLRAFWINHIQESVSSIRSSNTGTLNS